MDNSLGKFIGGINLGAGLFLIFHPVPATGSAGVMQLCAGTNMGIAASLLLP